MQFIQSREKSVRFTLLLATSVLLASCGSSEDKTETAPAEQESTETASAAIETTKETGMTDLSPDVAAYKARNEEFLAANAEQPGWTTLESGLQYQVVDEGPADAPQARLGDYVRVHYTLTLADGTTLDDSRARGEPAIFQLSEGLIPGWLQAIPLMSEGDNFKFAMPPELGYGDQSVRGLPAYSALSFDIELLDILSEAQLEAERNKAVAAREAAAKDYIAAQTAYLEKNAQKDGVTVLDSGLQYEVLESGDPAGATPNIDTPVEVHYHGTLTDGTVFDSSVDRGETITFAPNQVIPGWTEALQLMRPGDKWRLTIPSDMAYGERGTPSIPPHSTLIFEVTMISHVAGE